MNEQFNGRKIPIEDVICHIDANTLKYKSVLFDGADVNVGMLNLRMFAAKGCDCVACTVKGSFFRIERSGLGYSVFNDWHLNLYGLDRQGREVLMTKDHIHPKSKGGLDDLSNLQPMCINCNKSRGVMPMDVFMKGRMGQINPMSTVRFDKVKSRMHERYGIDIDEDVLLAMDIAAGTGRIVMNLNFGKFIREIKIRDRSIKVLYDSKCRVVLSAMPDEPDMWFFSEMLPKFAKAEPVRSKQLYDEIYMSAYKYYKTLDLSRPLKDLAMEIQMHPYSKIIFPLVKNIDNYKVSTYVWDYVRTKLENLTNK